MEEIKASSLFLPFDILNSQLVVLFHDLRKIFLTDRIRLVLCTDNRLNGHLLEMLHILREVQVVAGKGTANIIILTGTALRKFLEFRHDNVIAAAVTVSGRTHQIVDLFSSIQAEYHIAHFAVAELHDLIV